MFRAGPQSQKWSDQQITLNPTGSIHKKAREKKFDPKKVDFDEGVFICKFEKSLYKGQKSKLSQTLYMGIKTYQEKNTKPMKKTRAQSDLPVKRKSQKPPE